ncbi:N-alpha-acetyltransferase 60 [Trichinella pseudospiralis]|uniref:N-alpha-acetyltransferase 60 n=1 Tax=Trichinella pseudospiralis TaxID=6337 RepID=A0A0V1ISR7_TRIPS|nr:N-alpha-acetyltransferase 60 [Trichinella pseudospiralis]KRZ25796.1 N-alpha-acetyltransferase 60 [Trichinella pseudospiralis]KRZ31691.1 N-alpha-acetyltransferase 60 [Trichinella pseudospiralis]
MRNKSKLIEYTNMRVEHLPEVVNLFKQCFPVSYPMWWMEMITESKKYWKMVAIYQGKVVGVLWAIVGDLKQLTRQHYDTTMIRFFPPETLSCYILNIAVSNEFRRQKIASHLLELLCKSFTSSTEPFKRVSMVFLHVMVDNEPAIQFYEKMNFKRFLLIPDYYEIGENRKKVDAWIYTITFDETNPTIKRVEKNIFKKLLNTTVSIFSNLISFCRTS